MGSSKQQTHTGHCERCFTYTWISRDSEDKACCESCYKPQEYPYECGVETIVTHEDGSRTKQQIWGLTETEAKDLAEALNNPIEGCPILKPRQARVVYG
jgi:hypothetical protein